MLFFVFAHIGHPTQTQSLGDFNTCEGEIVVVLFNRGVPLGRKSKEREKGDIN